MTYRIVRIVPNYNDFDSYVGSTIRRAHANSYETPALALNIACRLNEQEEAEGGDSSHMVRDENDQFVYGPARVLDECPF